MPLDSHGLCWPYYTLGVEMGQGWVGAGVTAGLRLGSQPGRKANTEEWGVRATDHVVCRWMSSFQVAAGLSPPDRRSKTGKETPGQVRHTPA